MRRILICTGVLGGGTALVFALAALTATLLPQGTLVQANPWRGGGIAVPMPAPVNVIDPTLVDPAPDVTDEPLDALPAVIDDTGTGAETEDTPAP